MEVKSVVIVANGIKKETPRISNDIRTYLENRGVRCQLIITTSASEGISINPRTDLMICIGGDGTVLSCARMVQELGIPILAINLGTFGFITEIASDEWKSALDDIFEDKERISRRLMIRVSIIRNGAKIFQAAALNEAVVSSTGISKVVRLDLSVNRTKAGTFRSDGLIIATPTGSTGYSLAAGGPILDSEMAALIITPICPFTLSNRPLVMGPNEVITVHVNEGQRTGLMLTVDGQLDAELREGDDIVIEKSRSRALLIASNIRNYTEVLRSKLNWSGEMHA